MMFTVEGVYLGKPAVVTWEDGKLTPADTLIVEYIEWLAKNRQGELVGIFPVRVRVTKDWLKNPVQAWSLIQEAMDYVLKEIGDIPRPTLPRGVIV